MGDWERSSECGVIFPSPASWMLLSVIARAGATKWINLDIIVQKIKLKKMQMEMPEQIKHRFKIGLKATHILYTLQTCHQSWRPRLKRQNQAKGKELCSKNAHNKDPIQCLPPPYHFVLGKVEIPADLHRSCNEGLEYRTLSGYLQLGNILKLLFFNLTGGASKLFIYIFLAIHQVYIPCWHNGPSELIYSQNKLLGRMLVFLIKKMVQQCQRQIEP